MTGTLHHEGNLHTLRFVRRLAHGPEQVWRALTENSELTHWFPATIEGERRAGARLRFVFHPPGGTGATAGASGGDATGAGAESESTAVEGEMRVCDPPRTLEYSWGDEVLRWELRAEEPGTLLVFTHTFEEESKAARDASGWDVSLDALVRSLAGESPVPFTMERFDALFEKYAGRFGGRASARRAPDV
jgi:uncharacterized protein YndB with AHSA1/START domain